METGGGAPALGEDRDAVSVFVGVDEVDCVVECGDVQADEDRAEDFFFVTFHVGFYVGDYGWTNLRRFVSFEY